MRYAFTLLCIALLGCAHGVEDELPSQETEEETPQVTPKIVNEDENDGGNTLPCDRREVVRFEVNGRIVRFEVPSLCDPTPYVEKGDPPPWATQTPATLTSR
jgi:hypothetical protein